MSSFNLEFYSFMFSTWLFCSLPFHYDHFDRLFSILQYVKLFSFEAVIVGQIVDRLETALANFIARAQFNLAKNKQGLLWLQVE